MRFSPSMEGHYADTQRARNVALSPPVLGQDIGLRELGSDLRVGMPSFLRHSRLLGPDMSKRTKSASRPVSSLQVGLSFAKIFNRTLSRNSIRHIVLCGRHIQGVQERPVFVVILITCLGS
jgi:hypothetical protein